MFFALYALVPFPTVQRGCHDQCIRDLRIYMMRVHLHINVVQRDLSILSLDAHPWSRTPGLTSTLLLVHLPYSIPLLSVSLPAWPQNFSLCIFSL
jgi:hypothetical protein